MKKDEKLLKKLKEKYKEEQVFVVPFSAISGIENGLTTINDTHNLIWSKFDSVGKYIYRYDAEYNPTFQQLIPYVLIQNEKNNKYFIAERTAGEERLKSNLSIAFGGHINLEDGTSQVLLKAMARELSEELYLHAVSKANFIGYVRDYKAATNDHLGCVFLIKAKECYVKETESMNGLWMTLDELIDNYFKFENWSQYIINYLSQLQEKNAK